MYLSLWFGIIISGGQTGCTTLKDERPPVPMHAQAPRPVSPPPAVAPPSAGQRPRNPDYFQIPKVPPPGARVTYNGVNISEPYVAITFDDGPHATFTPRLLDMLKARNIKATFYILGSNAERYPNIVRRMIAEGHEVGNHTWSHPSLSSISEAAGREQMARTARKVTELTGYKMRTMRPPYGATNQHVKDWLYRDFGYPTILWTVDPLDWKRPGPSVVTSRILAGARPGAIILAHDIHGGTIDAMPATLDGLLKRGYRFVTVSQLLNMENRSLASASATPVPASAPPVSTPGPAPLMRPPVGGGAGIPLEGHAPMAPAPAF